MRQTDRNIDRQIEMLKARSSGVKRHHEMPGEDARRRYKEWLASHGDVAGEPVVNETKLHRRVTFSSRVGVFNDADEIVNNEWGVDGDDPPHPSTEHRERRARRLAPSKRLINLTSGRYREFYDLDLLAFQAGSYASDAEETTYLEPDIDGRLIRGVQLANPEEDDDLNETDDKPTQAHKDVPIDAEDLANEPELISSKPQVATETSEDNIVVEAIPEIEFEFGDEPAIELAIYY